MKETERVQMQFMCMYGALDLQGHVDYEQNLVMCEA